MLAARCSNFDPEMALTAGMMQDIGVLLFTFYKISNFSARFLPLMTHQKNNH